MSTSYSTDIAAWAREQAALLRSQHLSDIDVVNVAEEIESVAHKHDEALAHRLQQLVAHLLKWKCQPARRGHSWRSTIREQRKQIPLMLKKVPSLRCKLEDETWLSHCWSSGANKAYGETGLDFPADWIWSVEQVMDPDFWPD